MNDELTMNTMYEININALQHVRHTHPDMLFEWADTHPIGVFTLKQATDQVIDTYSAEIERLIRLHALSERPLYLIHNLAATPISLHVRLRERIHQASQVAEDLVLMGGMAYIVRSGMDTMFVMNLSATSARANPLLEQRAFSRLGDAFGWLRGIQD